MSSERRKIPFLSIALILIGVAVLFGELWHYHSANRNINQKWLSATGTIIVAVISPVQNNDRGKDRKGFTPFFQYRYFVDDKEYISERISQRKVIYDDEKSAQDFVNQFPAGQDMKMYYERGNPANSLLEFPSHEMNMVHIGVAILLAIAGLITWRFLRI